MRANPGRILSAQQVQIYQDEIGEKVEGKEEGENIAVVVYYKDDIPSLKLRALKYLTVK